MAEGPVRALRLGVLSDRTGERVKLLRFSAAVAMVGSLGLWWHGGAGWLVLLVMFTHTSSMMSLTGAPMAQLVAGDWGRYGRIRLWGSAGFLVTVLRQPAVRWFFASLLFHVMAHFAVYGFLSLYLDALGYGKATIGLLWAASVLAEIAWFFLQGRFIGSRSMSRWLLLCGLAAVLRFGLTAGLGASFVALVAALFTVIGYGMGGVLGVLAGGAIAQRFGYVAMFWVATGLAMIGTACAWRVEVTRAAQATPGSG